jgi:uncharacterized repeat protein (TIGR01451 family)
MTKKGVLLQVVLMRLAAYCRRLLFVLAMPAGFGLNQVAAQIPAPGTVIVNTATSTQQVGAILQTVTTAPVAVTVGGVVSPLPTLVKSFGSTSILAGASTPLVFRLTNSIGNPAQLGIGFTDTLPSGLRLTAGAAASVAGVGCSATVTLAAPSTITVSGAAMLAGTASCDISVNGITNASAANNDCSTNPPAFTNGAASISGLSNAVNGVTNQCLLVAPTLTVTAAPICVRDTPFVDYNANVLGLGAPNGVTVTWQKLSGEVVRVLTGQPLSGRLLWPGAAVDPSGNPVAWPGWAFVDGEWVPINDGLRPDMRIVFEVNPTAQAMVSYPPATPACNANPPSVSNVPDMMVMKSISAYQGSSPSGPYTVTLRYANAGAENAIKRDVTVSDSLPAGMRLVAGSMKVRAVTGDTHVSLSNASGIFSFGGSNGQYQTSASSISVSFDSLPQNAIGLITFDVTIDSGLASEGLLKNTADYVYTRSTGYTIMPRKSNTVTFKILGSESITLKGRTLPAVDPGSTVTFDNLLTNNTGRTDSFDISLSNSSFPAGTIFKLYKSDGTTLLADTDGNGIADTGPVANAGTYKIIVKAQIPNGVSGGPFAITKTAKSISNPLVSAADQDIVSAISSLCRMLWVPDNSGRVAPGGNIVYSHILTNVGNCTEQISFPPSFFDNSIAGWTVQLFIDNPTAGGASTVGAIDSSDTPVSATTSFTAPPGARLVFLARVTAPANAANGVNNITGLRINAGSSGVLAVTDSTTVSAASTGDVADIITGYIDSTFSRPTIWGFIGRPLYLRANAPSCNADSAVIERRTIIITGPNGEREEIIATETGPNTGMFVAEPLNIRLPPVMAGDMVLEGRPYDSYEVDLVGCGRKISTVVTLIDPNGVVFDSRTNQPVSGATVRIVAASGGVCTANAAAVSTLVAGQIAPAPNVVITGSDGRYDFPLVAPGEYCVLVTPPNGYTWTSSIPFTQLPAGRNIDATGPTTGGSYGGVFRVNQITGPVILDIPVDAGLIGGLFAQKTVQRSIVEVGEMLDYDIKLKNNTGYALDQNDVLLTDTLPAGFTYVKGSARKNGVVIADPQGGAGPKLVFNLGRMGKDQQASINYRVRVGPGAMQGDGVNRVVGSYRPDSGSTLYSESNVATAKVTISGGVFTDRAYIVGKVYADCNKDGVQASGNERDREVGVPGVRLFLQDGTNAITDAEGKFSFYGLLPRAHVLKIDRTTLPAGLSVNDLAQLSNRHLGKGDSRIVDLKQGELHKANFAIQSCTKSVAEEITSRRKAASSAVNEVDGRLQQKLETDPNLRPSNDVKALPASGLVGLMAPTANVSAPVALGSTVERPANPAVSSDSSFDSMLPVAVTNSSRPLTEKPRREPAIPLETMLPEEDNSLGFIGIKNEDVLAFTQMTVRVKGTAGVTFKLSVNGKEVAEDRIGKRAVLTEKKLQAWEYLGVNLVAGKNVLVVTQIDQFGNVRGEKSIDVVAPGALAKFVIEPLQNTANGNIADGKTPVKIAIRLLDGNGVGVTSRTAITLSTSSGRWAIEDLSAVEPGIQTFIEGGRAELEIIPPPEPGEARIRVVSGEVEAERKIDFLPDLREFIASGLIEGILNLRKFDSKGFSPARSSDGFEQEITHISRSWNGGERDAAARTAMFLKGKVKGEYLLTLAYDSDKNTRERLFRDIQPDEFYPIYGDSSVRGFDAQSTGRFYVRIDKKKSYLLYGDFNTSQYTDARKLANYSRSLTGVKHHFESGNIAANIFASRDTTRQIIDELPANGTSGPFVLTRIGGLINSEKVEILTRDRNQPSIIVRANPQSRFVDYELEPLTGRILFKAPIPSLDESLNPISVRITYEVDQGGNQFWVAGGDVQVKLADRLEVGASFVDDRNPMDKFRMAGVNAIARIADKTFLIGELAQTKRELFTNSTSRDKSSGNASRIEFRHAGANLDVNLYAGKAEKDFDNAGSSLGRGRKEMGGRLSYKIDERTRVKGELLQTEDIVGGAKRDGVLIAAEKTLESGLRIEAGIRHARETQPQVPAGSSAIAIPSEVTAARVRVTGDVPGLTDAAAYVEAEVDVKDSARKIAAIGGDYKLPNGGRVYARHEFISSLTGPYGLNSQQRQNSTVVGVSADYMKNANIFSEYRIRDAISGGDAEAAIGLRNTWALADGLQMHTGFERVHALSGTGDAESTAATFGLEYTANPLWKGSTRLEFRTSPNSDSILSTVAGAAKISRDWTFLGRNTYSLLKNKGQSSGESEQDRMQLGLAYRQTDSDVWNALGRIEHRAESDSTQVGIKLKRTVELVSIHANWQPRRPFTFSGRYAAKWVSDNSNGLSTKSTSHLVSGRVIWDLAPRWDISVSASTLLGKGTQSKHYGLGLELGFMVMENLWVSGGYNLFGYRDDDLASGEYTNKGVFVRLRYKFDEDLFSSASATKSATTKESGSEMSNSVGSTTGKTKHKEGV